MQEHTPIGASVKDVVQTLHFVVDQLTKTFVSKNGKTIAFENVSFNVMPGEFLAIVGPSGCGKSTLLRTLIGLEQATSGEFSVVPITGKDMPVIGMIFQEHGLFPWMTLRDNVRFPLKNANLSKLELDERCNNILHEVGLADFVNFYPHQVSGGMRQRASLARSFAYQSDILLMDEPFVHLDFQTRWQIHELFLRLWQRLKTTVIFVTHDIEEAILLADRVIVMTPRPGRVKSQYIIDFPRPRNALELKSSSPYNTYVNCIMKDLEN